MSAFITFLKKLALLFRRRQFNDELSEEMAFHHEQAEKELIDAGMAPKDAHYAAMSQFGNATRLKEQSHEVVGFWFERLSQDFRYAVRQLLRSPGFALTAIVTLALGIGANVVVFSILNGVVLRPLAVPQPANLFQVLRIKYGDPTSVGGYGQSYPDYRDFRDHDPSFSGLLAYKTIRAGVAFGKSSVESWGFAASGNYFDVLGIQRALGRLFHAADEHGLGSAPYIVLSNDFWRTHLNSDPNVVGKTVDLNQQAFTVIGIAPPDFHGTEVFFAPDYWIPLSNAEQVTGWSDYCCRDHLGIAILGRLKPGVTAQQATASLDSLALQMAKDDPKDDGLALRLRQPGPAGDSSDPTRMALLGIMLLAFLVLLAACANLASIFAARASDRSGELAIRLAIGATRWSVMRQLLMEAVTISIVGGFLGSSFARPLLGVLSHWQPFGDFPTHFLIVPDARVYLVAMALSIASGVFFGLLPARQIWRTDVVQTIKSGYVATESFRRFALRDLLLVVQVIVCTLLVSSSLVAVRGLLRALHVPLAFQPEGITLAQADLRMAGDSGEQSFPVQKRMLDAAAAIPGVTSAAVSDAVPFSGDGGDWFIYKWGTTAFLPAHMSFDANAFLISPGYLQTAETRMIAGRDFTWHDDGTSPRVAIVNQTFARRLYGGASPIGQRFALWATAKYQVVGEVEDGKYNSLGEDPEPAMFIPLAQGVGEVKSTNTTVLVRSQLPENQIAVALDRAIQGVESSAPITVRPWTDEVDISMMPTRAATAVLGVMGLLAAMLAVTGVFGMASYSVSKRMKEQSIRMALGAQRLHVLWATLQRPILLLLCGSCAGVFAGLLTSRLLAHLVSFATPHEPLVIFGVLLTMTLLGALATWIPARRALAIDPARLLRE